MVTGGSGNGYRVQIPDSKPLSGRAYARRRGVSHVAVQKAIASGRLAGAVDEQGKITDPDLADRLWVANTDYTDAPKAVREKFEGGGSGDHPPAPEDDSAADGMTTAEATRIQTIWKARQMELKFKEEAKQLVRRDDVVADRAADYAELRTKILGIPTQARQAMPHTSPEDLATWERLIREALEALAEEPASG